MAQQKHIRLGTMRTQVRSLASLSALRIQRCHELWCKLQTRLGSGIAVAVAVAGSYSSDLTRSLGTSICRRCSPKKTTKQNKTKYTLKRENTRSLGLGATGASRSPRPCPLSSFHKPPSLQPHAVPQEIWL